MIQKMNSLQEDLIAVGAKRYTVVSVVFCGVAAAAILAAVLVWCPLYIRIGFLAGAVVAVVLLILRAGINMLRSILKKTPDKKTALIFFGIFLTLTLCSLLLAWRIPTILMILASGAMGYALFSRKGAAK